jgi:hypothetical protein
MFVSIACYGLHIRPPWVHVPASLTATCQVWTVSLKAGLYTYKRPAGDGCHRPLRSRFRQQLMPGVRQSLPLTASAAKTYNLR